jgi:hypothetical protein
MRVGIRLGRAVLLAALAPQGGEGRAAEMRPAPLQSRATSVQPMTGIVLWNTNPAVATAPIQLEYCYFGYDQVVNEDGTYDWAALEKVLNETASRKHQAIIRWHDTYVARPTRVPAFIKKLPDYRETTANSEGKPTGFPDWSHPTWQAFVLDFFKAFAARYDRDPRLAFLEVGFGLWAEYHIYDGPMILGKTFPDRAYQARFARNLAEHLEETPWMISVDAAGGHAPFAGDRALLGLPFGVFDDSFNHAKHAKENEPNWNAMGRDRWKRAPAGGEFSFFERADQRDALTKRGPHGEPFEAEAVRFHVTFMIGDAQPRFQPAERIREAGMACGYRFRATKYEVGEAASEATITNTGVAPIYHDAFPAVNGVRSSQSLKGLLPGESRAFGIEAGGANPTLTIESDRLVPGQRIEYDADLP